jgi:GT2 family glycosyltransferase
MKIAAVTITYNRLELTKKTVDSFYSKTNVDYHLFVDNGSTDGTQEYLKSKFDHVPLDKNYGITEAFRVGVERLKDFDFILKLDNDIETVTDQIIEKMLKFYELNGTKFVCSPVDLNLDPNYAPRSFGKGNLNGYNVSYVSHTGGAFQMIPIDICLKLMEDYHHFKLGDQAIGGFYQANNYKPVYLTDLEMRHIGLNQTTGDYIL